MRRSHRQSSEAYSAFFDYHNASGIKSCSKGRQIKAQELQLLCRSIRSPSKKNNGRLCFPAQCQNARKIGVGGDEHALLRSCAVENHIVSRRLQIVLANVNRVVTGLPQSFAISGDKALSMRNFKTGG
ncbi:MAG: hypothetical protein WAK62_06205 [Terriglobales bacterium]